MRTVPLNSLSERMEDMGSKQKKRWAKPELTCISVQGVGNDQCTTGLQRATVCSMSASGNIGSVSCNQQTKDTVFS